MQHLMQKVFVMVVANAVGSMGSCTAPPPEHVTFVQRQAKRMQSLGGKSAANETAIFVNGATVYVKQPGHGTYLGMCGNVRHCGSSKNGVYGYPTKESRTQWVVETSGSNVYLKQSGHGTYLGLCGNVGHCGSSKNGVYGYPTKESRTRWVVETSGSDVYLRQPDHRAYLGMCGNAKGCGNSINGVYGYATKQSRTKWVVEQAVTPSPTETPTVPPTAKPTMPAECASWCELDTRSWQTKCVYQACSSCAKCAPTGPDCQSWCEYDTRPWSTKCTLESTCGDCGECALLVPTTGMPIAPQATVSMVQIEIAGSYKRTRTENFEQFLDKLGTSFMIKKLLTIHTSRLTIESVNGNEWRTTFSMGSKTTPFQFAFNTPVKKQTTWYYKTGTTKVVQEGDNKWVFFIEGENNIDVKETWVFADASISIEYMSGDVVAKQTFSRQ